MRSLCCVVAVMFWLAGCGGDDPDTVVAACEIFIDCGLSTGPADACAGELDNCAPAAQDSYLACLELCIGDYESDASCTAMDSCEQSCWGQASC